MAEGAPMAAAAGPPTPHGMGLSAESLWDVLEPRHVGVSWGAQQAMVSAEAVLVHENQEQGVFFLPASVAPGGAEILSVPSQGDDGSDQAELLMGFFQAIPGGDYLLGVLPENAHTFSPDGGTPSLGATVPFVPFELLPEDLVDLITNLPFADAEEPADMFGGLVEQVGPDPLLGPGDHRRYVPPSEPEAPPGGVTPIPLAPPPEMALPPAGRGRALVGAGAGPAANAPPPRGRGRGTGAGRGAAGGPRLTMGALSAQIMEGFAAVRVQGEAFNARLTALEAGGAANAGASPELENRLRMLEARPQMSPPPLGAHGTGVPPLLGALPPPAVGGRPLVQAPPPGLSVPPMAPLAGMPPQPLQQQQAAVRRQPPLTSAMAPPPGRTAGTGHGVAAAVAPPPGRFAGMPPGALPTRGPQASATPQQDMLLQAMTEQARAMAAMATMHSGENGGGLLDESAGSAISGIRGGARGAAALLKWRRVFNEQPQLITTRVRQARNRAMSGLAATPDLVPSMRNYFATEVPFGHAKTAAYLVFGLTDVADLMEAGRWLEAEALTNLLLSAAEQAALQEWQWGMAWLLTFSPEPPWARIRTPAPAASDLKSVGRLADPELLAAAVGHMKDFMAISEAQKRTGPPRAAHEGAEEDGGKAGGKGAQARVAKAAAAKAAAEKKKAAAAGAAAGGPHNG